MRYKELKVVDIPKWGTFLREQWRINFASHLSNEEQKSIGMDRFLWHLCSWEKVNCLEKDAAIEAFNKQSKIKCTVFYQFIDEAYLVQNAQTLNVDELPYDQSHMFYGDIYIMDWDLNWTLIMTHSDNSGPYFIKN